MKPVPGAPRLLQRTPQAIELEARRRRSIVAKFLEQGLSPKAATRAAAMYLATLRYEDRVRAKRDAARAVSAEQVATSPIWQPPRGLDPHERLAARIAAFCRVSSETAHRKAAQIARESDAKDAA